MKKLDAEWRAAEKRCVEARAHFEDVKKRWVARMDELNWPLAVKL